LVLIKQTHYTFYLAAMSVGWVYSYVWTHTHTFFPLDFNLPSLPQRGSTKLEKTRQGEASQYQVGLDRNKNFGLNVI